MRGKKGSKDGKPVSQTSPAVEEVAQLWKELQKGRDISVQLTAFGKAPESGRRSYAEAKAALFFAAEQASRVFKHSNSATDQSLTVALKALVKGFSVQNSLPCALLFAQLLVELGDKVPPGFVALALALKRQATGISWEDPREDLLPYSEEDRTFGDEVKGNTPLDRISWGCKQLTERLAAIREPPQGRTGLDSGKIKPGDEAQLDVKGAADKLMEAVRSSHHLMPGRKANLTRVYRRDDQARLKQAAKADRQLERLLQRQETQQRDRERPQDKAAEAKAQAELEKRTKVKDLLLCKLSNVPLEQRFEAASELLSFSTNDLEEKLGEGQAAKEVLHILQECWKEGHAAEEAWEAGRPPELAQPPADYEVQRTQILGQLQQVCSRAEGACTPQFVVEQTSAETGPNWEGEIPSYIDARYLGLTQKEEAAVLRQMKTRPLEFHPIGAETISFRGTPPESTSLLQECSFSYTISRKEIDPLDVWKLLYDTGNFDDWAAMVADVNGGMEEVPAAEEIYDVSIQHGRLLVAASRLAQLHYSGSACSREGAQQLCRDMAPLRNGLLCTSDHSTEAPQQNGAWLDDAAEEALDSSDDKDAAEVWISQQSTSGPLAAPENRWGSVCGMCIPAHQLLRPLATPYHDGPPADDREGAVSKADNICFVLDALRLLQSEHALSQLAMHFIACALARDVGEYASEAGILRKVLESEWLPDEGDVAWEHLALLGRKELAAFSDNIAVFLNSRSPLLETLHKQINAMTEGDTMFNLDRPGRLGLNPGAFSGSEGLHTSKIPSLQDTEAAGRDVAQAAVGTAQAAAEDGAATAPVPPGNSSLGNQTGSAGPQEPPAAPALVHTLELSEEERTDKLTEFVEQVMGSLFGDEPPDQAITPELANVTPEALRPYVDECQKVEQHRTLRDRLRSAHQLILQAYELSTRLPTELRIADVLTSTAFEENLQLTTDRIELALEPLQGRLDFPRWGKPLLDAVAMSQPAWKVIQEFEQDWWASIPRQGLRMMNQTGLLCARWPRASSALQAVIKVLTSGVEGALLEEAARLEAALVGARRGTEELLDELIDTPQKKLLRAAYTVLRSKIEGLLMESEEAHRRQLEAELLEEEAATKVAGAGKDRKKKKKQQAGRTKQAAVLEQAMDEEWLPSEDHAAKENGSAEKAAVDPGAEELLRRQAEYEKFLVGLEEREGEESWITVNSSTGRESLEAAAGSGHTPGAGQAASGAGGSEPADDPSCKPPGDLDEEAHAAAESGANGKRKKKKKTRGSQGLVASGSEPPEEEANEDGWQPVQTRKRRGRSESAKDSNGEEAPPQLQPEEAAENGAATAAGVRPHPQQGRTLPQPKEAEPHSPAQAGGDWNSAAEVQTGGDWNSTAEVQAGGDWNSAAEALAEEQHAWDSEPRPAVGDKWEAAAAGDEQDRSSTSAQPQEQRRAVLLEPVDDRRRGTVQTTRSDQGPEPSRDTGPPARPDPVRSLPRGCLTCGSSTHSFKDCRRYRQMTDTQQKEFLARYGLEWRSRGERAPRGGCFLCKEQHAFAVCPNIPEGATREEREALYSACKEGRMDIAEQSLGSILDRLNRGVSYSQQQQHPTGATSDRPRQPINRPLEPPAAAPPGSWPAMTAGKQPQPGPRLEQLEEGPHVMTWSRVVNPEAPSMHPPPTSQRHALEEPSSPQPHSSRGDRHRGQPQPEPPVRQRSAEGEPATLNEVPREVASVHQQPRDKPPMDMRFAFMYQEVHDPEPPLQPQPQPPPPPNRPPNQHSARLFPAHLTQRELGSSPSGAAEIGHPSDDRRSWQSSSTDLGSRPQGPWPRQGPQEWQEAESQPPTGPQRRTAPPPGFAAGNYLRPPQDARTGPPGPRETPVSPPGFAARQQQPPVLGPQRLVPQPPPSPVQGARAAERQPFGPPRSVPGPPMVPAASEEDSNVDDLMSLLGVKLNSVPSADARLPRPLPLDKTWSQAAAFAAPAESEGEDDGDDEDFQKAIQASLIETRLPAADLAAVRPVAAGAQVSDVATPGLQNDTGEYNCFLNCIIQCLWHCKEFRQHVQRWTPAQVEGNAVVAALVELFRSFAAEEAQHAATGWHDRRRQVVTPIALRCALHDWSQNHFRLGEMSDAAEVLSALYDSLELVADGGRLIERLFQWQVHQFVECLSCGKRSHDTQYAQFFYHTFATALRLERAVDLEEEVDPASLGTLLARVEAQAQKSCDTDRGGCGNLNPVQHSLQKGSFPARVFTLQLGWEKEQESSADIADTLATISEEVDVAQVFSGGAKPFVYALRSIICYYGLHYHAFVKDRATEAWRMFDDTVTSTIGDWAAVRTKCQMGKIQPSVLFYEATWTRSL